MKKLFLFIGVSIILQTAFYLLFMKDDFSLEKYYYNPISIISVLSFLILYIKNSFYTLKYGTFHRFKNIIITFVMIIMLSVLCLFLSVWTQLGVQMLYFTINNDNISRYNNPFFYNLWDYNLIFLNYLYFMLNIFTYTAKAFPQKQSKAFVYFHKITTGFILGLFAYLIVFKLDFFYYHIFLMTIAFIYWLLTPFIKRAIEEYHYHFGVLVAWSICIISLWPLFNFVFSQLNSTYAYIPG